MRDVFSGKVGPECGSLRLFLPAPGRSSQRPGGHRYVGHGFPLKSNQNMTCCTELAAAPSGEARMATTTFTGTKKWEELAGWYQRFPFGDGDGYPVKITPETAYFM